jgi:mannose-1-phosphate guanylyltransferase/mannose-6-phosphate isomerase
LKYRLIPVILSGGSGTRLWPLSTPEKPKQFHALASERSLIQETLARMSATADVHVGAPIVISSMRNAALVRAQLSEAGAACQLILEPFGRNTAAAAVFAALSAQAADPEALVLLMPADHRIGDGFSETVAGAAGVARDRIVVFGVKPSRPETGYGYIEVGASLAGAASEVARFTEKPNLATAEAYVAGGRHLWNAGIFLFSPAVLLAEMERHAPEVLRAARATLAASKGADDALYLDPAAFAECPSISLDYAVMEKTDRAAIVPLESDWADLGSWGEIWRLSAKDDAGNVVRGDALVIDSSGSLVWSETQAVGVIGVSELVVVQTKEALLILPRSRTEEVKQLVEQLAARAAKSDADSGGKT